MKIDIRETINWIGVVVVILAIGSCTGFMVVDVKSSYEETKVNKLIREKNGGALPDIEAVNAKGRTYVVDRITFEGVNYLCFSQGRRMGCMKEEKP